MKQVFCNAVDRLCAAVEWMVTGCICVLMISIVWQVVTRFVINAPAIWTEEIARYAFIYMVFLGTAVGVRRNAHFGLSALPDSMTPRTRTLYIRYIVNSVIGISGLLMLIYGTEFVYDFGFTRVSPTFLVPMAWAFAVMPISAALMLLFAVCNMLDGDYSQASHS